MPRRSNSRAVEAKCALFSHAHSQSAFVVQVEVVTDTHFTSCLPQDEALCVVHFPEVFTPSRTMSYTTPLMSSTPSLGTCTPSFPTTRPTSTSSDLLLSEIEPFADPRLVSVRNLAELPTFTGCEPKHLAEDKDVAEHEDLRVKPFFFHQPSTASTYDSAERISTLPPESDSDDEQIRALLASPLCMQERETNADRSQVYHSVRENLMSSSSQDPKQYGETRCVVFTQKQVESRNVFR